MNGTYQVADMNSRPRIGFGDRKSLDTLKVLINGTATVEGTESTHYHHTAGSVAVAGPARTLTNPGFDLQLPRNLHWRGSSYLDTLLVYHSRLYSHPWSQAIPNSMYLPRRTSRQRRLRAPHQTGRPQGDNRARSRLQPFVGPRWNSGSSKRWEVERTGLSPGPSSKKS
jgi:hypothetical protein